ncbi:DUF6183 family protein [Streptomyces sp. NPDC029674]|uniref:DUF6183 family protein n=1 Tax=Streptomyces sp. NPDC029674 TaxID=3365297 RepID=UPI00384E8DF8
MSDERILPDPAELKSLAGARPDRLRALASELASDRRLPHLETLFTEPPRSATDSEAELRACVLGELALRGVPWRERPAIEAYAERLRELGHPLARLPETRLDLEHRFGARTRGVGPVRSAGQLRARFPEAPDTAGGVAAGATARETPDAARSRAAAGAFTAGGWAKEPEARFFALPRPLRDDDFGMAFLRGLPLDCLAGEPGRGGMLSCLTAADDAAAQLYVAACDGGVNGRPQYGAYARLHAWEGLYALLGLPPGTPFLDAVRYAADSRWLRFMAFTSWFHHDTADVGLAVLDPSRTRVAVLAATDTDESDDMLGLARRP